MDNNIYETPKAELINETANDGIGDMFYVVSKRKLVVLYLLSMGLYSLYWVFQNWRLYMDYVDDHIMPVWRAIFQIFFMHSLFARVDQELVDQKKSYSWSPMAMATLYVVACIISAVLDALSGNEVGSPWTDVLSFFSLPFTLYALVKAQGAINLSQGDPEGESNNRFTIWNILWMIVFTLFWALAILGTLMMTGVIPVE